MSFKLVEADLSDPVVLNVANLFVLWGQDEGTIPADRCPIDENEEAIFACVDAPVENGIVGGAIFYQPEGHDMLFLDILYVSPVDRRKGIGGALVRRICAIAAERGLAKVEFGTLVTNQRMQALGHALGFADYALMMNCRLDTKGAS
ncbi:GNAT family N-acetyltransferase [Mesorhizobium sp. Root157]|uniref:GNAT family N-acetyltransferase n=1 Tax=Mesorhizobium sp. Root157 TaxID=1736477 RepID=UPI000AAA11B9|nr:GNAT family N-acetyltransferase [Mesorhizobium sp. Root157]